MYYQLADHLLLVFSQRNLRFYNCGAGVSGEHMWFRWMLLLFIECCSKPSVKLSIATVIMLITCSFLASATCTDLFQSSYLGARGLHARCIT